GDEITPYYDSMVGKLIVWDENRVRAIKRMRAVLDDVVIFGVKTNIPLLKAIIEHIDFLSGKFNTQFMKNYFDEGLAPEPLAGWQQKLNDTLRARDSRPAGEAAQALPSPWEQSWRGV
ncbi:MAG TPA: acetyl-CoA carboxylase biotin carboxylase subunit, partial [Bdellovibrionales bacterium]|nr:acetyl-CoA carboxylase biotin carboxylase subunit [Bdellovibrionales bacterium]